MLRKEGDKNGYWTAAISPRQARSIQILAFPALCAIWPTNVGGSIFSSIRYSCCSGRRGMACGCYAVVSQGARQCGHKGVCQELVHMKVGYSGTSSSGTKK